MKHTLILLRHAKSSWDDPGLDDVDRPLNFRGLRDAPRVGHWLADNRFLPDRAYCSPAVRARQTLAALGLNSPSTMVDGLYMASPATLLKTIRAAIEPTILIIAHNPGIGALAHQIVAKAPEHPRFRDFPTAATLVAEFDLDDWKDAKPGKGVVVAFATPHDLPDLG